MFHQDSCGQEKSSESVEDREKNKCFGTVADWGDNNGIYISRVFELGKIGK